MNNEHKFLLIVAANCEGYSDRCHLFSDERSLNTHLTNFMNEENKHKYTVFSLHQPCQINAVKITLPVEYKTIYQAIAGGGDDNELH